MNDHQADAAVESLRERLTDEQRAAVESEARQLLLVAGAGSGKTEVMARRVARWIAVEGVPKDQIIAFTFTEKAAEEMKFRIRKWVGVVTPEGEDATLGGMYVGTIHAFCLQMLQELAPQDYGVFDVLDDAGRLALVQRGFHSPLALNDLKTALGTGQFETINRFLRAYDLLNEHAMIAVSGIAGPRPAIGPGERDWIKLASLDTDVGQGDAAQAFATSAARYYANLQARRFLDFSTAQAELVKLLENNQPARDLLRARFSRVVVDEFQDINPVQDRLIRLLTGDKGHLTAVGDHRQAIYGFRGGRVEIMAGWYQELTDAGDGEVLDLPHNFRATPRLIDLANRWAATITTLGTMPTPTMAHGRTSRLDRHDSHVSIRHFPSRVAEAGWIAETIQSLVDANQDLGATHDVDEDRDRGIGLPDIAVLVRSSTDIRTYMDALEAAGIPVVVRAGPDLFKRPEVLVMLNAMAIAAGIDSYFGGVPPTMASIAQDQLNCQPLPEEMLRAAAAQLAAAGLPIVAGAVDRLVAAAEQMQLRISGEQVVPNVVGTLQTAELRAWLRQAGQPRRLFPQTLYQWLAAELGVAGWDAQGTPRSQAAMFHLGQVSALLTGIETPGWVPPDEFKWQMIALVNWGPRNARSDEAPLLVPPNAVTILTVHAAKGLEFPVVFLADIAAQRFPSSRARVAANLPVEDPALAAINPASLSDNANYDAERRLMYVALTRAERFLFLSAAGPKRSQFKKQLENLIPAVGGLADPPAPPHVGQMVQTETSPNFRLVTSFSDLRYYLECPHDYYLRKVLGFAPTIDQAFGYGRGVHNLMRAIHLDAAHYAQLAATPDQLRASVDGLIEDGLMYLRYTTGDPLENMKKRAAEVVTDYIRHYRDELGQLEFEPERSFETLLEEAGVLVSGTVDLIRRDDPPRVTLIDFKSGDPEKEGENASALDEELMQLQVSVYGIAAKTELEYEPEQGLVRYLGVPEGADTDQRELAVPLDPQALATARQVIVEVATNIQNRQWDVGPQRPPKKPGHNIRCQECDFVRLCGRPEAH